MNKANAILQIVTGIGETCSLCIVHVLCYLVDAICRKVLQPVARRKNNEVSSHQDASLVLKLWFWTAVKVMLIESSEATFNGGRGEAYTYHIATSSSTEVALLILLANKGCCVADGSQQLEVFIYIYIYNEMMWRMIKACEYIRRQIIMRRDSGVEEEW